MPIPQFPLVVSWEISSSLESDFCISALNRALIKANPNFSLKLTKKLLLMR